MLVNPEQTLAIITFVIGLTQFAKRVIPGDWDEYGPALAGLFSLIGVLTWVTQYRPDALMLAPFDIAVLTVAVYTGATGGYTIARQVTNVGGRSIRKLRAARDAGDTEAPS